MKDKPCKKDEPSMKDKPTKFERELMEGENLTLEEARAKIRYYFKHVYV